MLSKPIILVVGHPHSMTSMIAKFLLDNGAVTGEDLINENLKNIKYPRYEDRSFVQVVRDMTKFKKIDKEALTAYLEQFPKNENILLKAPMGAFFIDTILDCVKGRPVKVVYVLRNPADVIKSSIEKGSPQKNFMSYFHRWCDMYMACTDYEDLLPFMAERIYQDGRRLLDFCDLPRDDINFDSVKLRKRHTTFLKHRIKNFWWKRLYTFLQEKVEGQSEVDD